MLVSYALGSYVVIIIVFSMDVVFSPLLDNYYTAVEMALCFPPNTMIIPGLTLGKVVPDCPQSS